MRLTSIRKLDERVRGDNDNIINNEKREHYQIVRTYKYL